MSDFADAFGKAFDLDHENNVWNWFGEALGRADVPEPRKCETVQELAGWFVRAGRAAGSIVKRENA